MNKKNQRLCIILLMALFATPVKLSAATFQSKTYEVLLHTTAGHRKRHRIFSGKVETITCVYTDGSLYFSFPSPIEYIDVCIKDGNGNIMKTDRIMSAENMIQIPENTNIYIIEVQLPDGEILAGTLDI